MKTDETREKLQNATGASGVPESPQAAEVTAEAREFGEALLNGRLTVDQMLAAATRVAERNAASRQPAPDAYVPPVKPGTVRLCDDPRWDATFDPEVDLHEPFETIAGPVFHTPPAAAVHVPDDGGEAVLELLDVKGFGGVFFTCPKDGPPRIDFASVAGSIRSCVHLVRPGTFVFEVPAQEGERWATNGVWQTRWPAPSVEGDRRPVNGVPT